MFLGDPAADGQPQPQAMGRRVHKLPLPVSLKDGFQPLLRDPTSSIRDPDLHLSARTDLQRNLSPFGGKFKRVAQQIQQHPFQPLRVHGNDVALPVTAKFQLQPKQYSGILCPAQNLPTKAHNIIVAQIQRHRPVQLCCVRQIVGQTEDPVVTLAQHCGVYIQLLIRIPLLRRRDPLQCKIDVSQ